MRSDVSLDLLLHVLTGTEDEAGECAICSPFGFTARCCYSLSKNCFTVRKRRNAQMKNGESEVRNAEALAASVIWILSG